MSRATNASLLLVMAVLIGSAGGCATETHAQAKTAAMARWNTARSNINLNMGREQFEAGDLEKAEQTCRQVISQSANSSPAHELLGRVYLEKNDLEQAAAALEKAVSLEEKRGTSHYLLGVVHQRWLKCETALACYKKAYECSPEDPAGLIAAAEMLVKLDRPQEALQLLEDQLGHFQHSAAMQAAMGRVHMAAGRFDQALICFHEATLLAPEDLTLTEDLAMAELANRDPVGAIAHFQLLLSKERYNNRSDLRMALGDCYVTAGKAADGRLIYLALTRDNPGNVVAWIKLGQVAWMLGDDTHLNIAAQKVVALAPQRYEGHMLRGMALTKSGEIPAALAELDKAAAVAPDSALPLIVKGMMLEQSGDKPAAAVAYGQALTRDPGDDRARTLLAGVE